MVHGLETSFACSASQAAAPAFIQLLHLTSAALPSYGTTETGGVSPEC